MNKKEIQDLLNLFRSSGGLKRIRRTGWVLKGIQEAESVADHVFRVVFMCSVLAPGRKLDEKKLLDMALIHDLGETATSDIRWQEGKKFLAPEKSKNEIEESILKKILPHTQNEKYYLSLFYDFRDQTSPEAKFLKEVEKLEMALQALEYQEFGAKKELMNEFFENAKKYITDPELKRMFEEIEKAR
ncbi:MAG: Phosphohydrolase [Candidatus Woesebacteria bacterium GW2011_GWB1_39_10b]|uniref:5'-deoxynucleotidase n=1 Tax=Candidatus Woesebacteria bacterium GW2011_GWB1_39_10b TaxID=1618573 RepID=A0A0G0LPJ0_9BACT|nr:MAG: hypothetical protein US72_C0008G0051 [Microgenomates group bacterium GW2011_GWC1_38_12]KKQ92987.1 MAG: Phosphohydrolase [Candidatus Woesebacteria bacterium GW2011_GWB1_39_10b]